MSMLMDPRWFSEDDRFVPLAELLFFLGLEADLLFLLPRLFQKLRLVTSVCLALLTFLLHNVYIQVAN